MPRIQWNQKNPQNMQDGVTATLTLSCRPDGAIHLETPTSQGGFSETYTTPDEATQGLIALFEEGMDQAASLNQ